MAIGIKTSGLHHVALRSTDMQRSREFYVDLLGFPIVVESPAIFLFSAGNAVFGVRGPAPQTMGADTFDPFRVGLDHIALA